MGAAHRGSVADSFGGTVAADADVAVVAHAGGCGEREAWHAAAAAVAAGGGQRKGGDVVGGGGDDGEHPGGPVAGPAAQASGWQKKIQHIIFRNFFWNFLKEKFKFQEKYTFFLLVMYTDSFFCIYKLTDLISQGTTLLKYKIRHKIKS